jgi:RNA polymerase sigma factor (TIGR02999 family)
MSEVTQILSAIDAGDPRAAEQLLPLVYDELRKLAALKLLQVIPGQTLQATALVHEAYMRLVATSDNENDGSWNGRGHFFAAAAEAMRRILVDRAREKAADKRGGAWKRVALDRAEGAAGAPPEDLLALDEALEQLERLDPCAARLVKLRYFAGLTVEQAAVTLGVSAATAYRYWSFARAWLHSQLAADHGP